MAAPHVAGAMALAMADKDFSTPQEVYEFLTAAATPNVLKLVPNNTVNLLLFNAIDKLQTTIDIDAEEGEEIEAPPALKPVTPDEPEMEIAFDDFE